MIISCYERRNPVVQNMEDDDDLSLTFSSSLLYVFWCIIKFFVDFSYSESFFDAFYNSSVASGLEMKWLCAYNLNFHYFTLMAFTVVVIRPQLRIWDHYVISYEFRFCFCETKQNGFPSNQSICHTANNTVLEGAPSSLCYLNYF